VRWLARWLQSRETKGQESEARTEEDSVLWATPTGQLASSGGSETVSSILRRDAEALKRPLPSLQALRQALGAREAEPAGFERAAPDADGWVPLRIFSEGGVTLQAQLRVPPSPRAAVILPGVLPGADPDAQEFAAAGYAVLRLEPRGERESKGGGVGGYSRAYQIAARAILLGRNLPEMQAADLIRARQVLARQLPGVPVRLFARGAIGPAALFAAVLDPGFAAVALERSILSYHSVLESRIHRGLETAVVPGILKTIDLPGAVELLGGRPAVWISPITPAGAAFPPEAARRVQPKAAIVSRGEAWTLARTIPDWFAARPR
jgi:hypothetical protein